MSLSISFPDFFRALWEFDPFPGRRNLPLGSPPGIPRVRRRPHRKRQNGKSRRRPVRAGKPGLTPPVGRTVGRRIFFIANPTSKCRNFTPAARA